MRCLRRLMAPLSIVTLSCAVLLIVAGCGDSGAENGDGGDGPTGPATPAATAAGGAQDDGKGTTYSNDELGFSVTYDPERFGVFEEMPEGSGFGVLIADESESSGPAAVRISVVPAGDLETTYEPGSGEAMTVLRNQFDGIREDLSGADYSAPWECTLGGLPALCAEVKGAIPALPLDADELTGRLYGTVWGNSTMLVFVGAPSAVWGEVEGVLTEVVESITIDAAAN